MCFNKLYALVAPLAILLTCSTAAWAVEKPKALPLPAGMNISEPSPSKCITKSDTDKLMAWIDANRVKIPACNIGVVAPEVMVQAYKRTLPGMNINGNHNCELTRKNYFSSGHMDVFVDEFQAQVKKGTAQSKNCAANMLYYWAQKNAMGDISKAESDHITASQFARMTVLSGVTSKLFMQPDTLLYLGFEKINVKGKLKTRKDVVLEWLEGIALKVSGEIDGLIASDQINNRLYWNAYAVLPIGLMQQNKKLIEKSEKVFLLGMHEIDKSRPNADDRGFMPTEIARKQRAMQYHVYSLRPLLGMALLSKSYNCDFAASQWRRSQLGNSLRKTMEGSYDKSVFTNEIKRVTGSSVTLLPADGRHLLFMASRIDPLIYENVKSYLVGKGHVKANDKILLRKYGPQKNEYYGAGENDIQLGGSYFQLAEKVRTLDSGKCPANIWQEK